MQINYAPRHRYAYAAGSLELSRKIGEHYNLYAKAYLQTVIVDARWNHDNRKWYVATNRGDRMRCDHFVMACGRQRLPKLPAIERLDKFRGHAFHSSRWDYNYSGGSETDFQLTKLKEKRVAVIGTGATAILIVPEVAKWAKEQFLFQRTPSAVYMRGQMKTGADYADMSKPG